MKYEKWEDVPEWLQKAVKGGANVYDAPFDGLLYLVSKGMEYTVSDEGYTSAVHLYESRTLDDATPQEWDEVARKQYDSPDTPIPKRPSYISEDEVVSDAMEKAFKNIPRVGRGVPINKEVKVGENWFVKIPNNNSLTKVEVVFLTDCVVGLKTLGLPRENYWVRKEVEFVEEIK